jgi:hypothetical protein
MPYPVRFPTTALGLLGRRNQRGLRLAMSEPLGQDGGITRFSGSNWPCGRYTTKASIRSPYCTGAAMPAWNVPRVCAPHDPNAQTWAQCSVTSQGWGLGKWNT